MDEELKELKSVLRSLVVSSPTQVDVRSLLRDYRNMMGNPVPLTKYGYRDPVLFLRERFSDCFLFQGPQNNPILTLIVPDTLKHIDEFVQRQKLSSTLKYKGKRRSIPEQVIRKPHQNLVVSTFVPKNNNKNVYNTSPQIAPKTTAPQTKPVAGTPRQITKNNNSVQHEIVPLNKSMNKLNIQAKLVSKEPTVCNKENEQVNCNIVDSQQDKNCSQSALQNFLKKRLPIYSSSHNIEKYDTDLASSKGDDDSGRQTSSSSSSTKAALLEELKLEIKKLVAEHPEGVWVTDLIGLYRERYKRELNFSRFGYTSIISLVCVLEDAVQIQRSDDGKWLLLDAAARAARPRRLPLGARLATAHHDRVDPDDALPGIDFDPDVFPPDCMHFMESIPPMSLAELQPGAMLEAMLGEVYSPSHFWLQRLGEAHLMAMEDVMDAMTEYYTHGEGKDRTLALGAVRVGHYCSSLYEGDWHRSLIVRVQDTETVKVRHIDYGTVESVAASSLKPLRREWGALPAQAVRARLAAVRPPAAGRRWPHAAAAHFLALVRDRRLVANVVAVDREEDILEVFLIDTSTDEDVCISAQMVRSGHADARADSALRTSECYLYPRFDALEAGATPNYGEIHAYLRDGIALEFVDEYRRHVPACLPPAPAAFESEPGDALAQEKPPASPESISSSGPEDVSEDESSTDDSPAGDRALSPDSIERAPRAARAAGTPPLARAASSPGGRSAHAAHAARAARAARAASAHPDLAPLAANRVPLRPDCAPFEPRAPAFHPPVRTHLPHAYSQMLPMPGYAGFPPFPGAVPLYPPMYPSPPAVVFPYSPPHPFHPVPGPPAPHPWPGPPAPYQVTPSSAPPTSRAYSGPPTSQTCSVHQAHQSFSGPGGAQTLSDRTMSQACPVATTPQTYSGPPVSQPCSGAPTTHPSAIPPAFRPPAASSVPPDPTRPSSPPPPYNGATESDRTRFGQATGDVKLSVSECEIFRLLSSVDPNAAHWYMVDAISRAMHSRSALNPAAAEFRAQRPRVPPGMRPPPGFGY